MKTIITSKNLKTNEKLKDTIENKMSKLDKYFTDDISVNVMLSSKNKRDKMEATIKMRNVVFRAEYKAEDIYTCIDRVVDKLASQMSRFKDKLIKKHKGQPGIKFGEWPDSSSENESEVAGELNIVKKKKFDLEPLSVEDAVMRMELIGHNFFLFINSETNVVNLVYRREDGNYGLLETVY